MAAALKRMTGGKMRNLPIAKAGGGRKMVVSVGRVQDDISLTTADIREMEKLMGASRRKREGLMAWLRQKSRKLVAAHVREELVKLDRSLLHLYRVVDLEVEEYVEDIPPATGSAPAPGPQAAQPPEEPLAAEPPPKEHPATEPLATETPAAAPRRSRRGAAQEADKSMEESFEKGDLSLSKDEEQMFKKPCRKRKISKKKERSEKKRKVGEGDGKKKEKKKKMKTVIVTKPLVYLTDLPSFFEDVRVARGLTAEETMVRVGIDAGQGSLKVVANVFSK